MRNRHTFKRCSSWLPYHYSSDILDSGATQTEDQMADHSDQAVGGDPGNAAAGELSPTRFPMIMLQHDTK